MREMIIAFITLMALVALVMGGAVSCVREKPGPKPAALKVPTPSLTPTLKARVTPTPTEEVSPIPTPTVVTLTLTPTEEVPAPTPTAEAPTPTLTGKPPTPKPMPTATPSAGFPYTVRRGDTLFSIAQCFGTTVGAIAQLNEISDPDALFAGQRLIIPGRAPLKVTVHIVQPGESLFRIALKYGTTVEAIASANRIFNPHHIFVGQRLVIPGGRVPARRIHIVRWGETLTSIALRYGTTPQAIAVANNLVNPNLLYVGQMLRIP